MRQQKKYYDNGDIDNRKGLDLADLATRFHKLHPEMTYTQAVCAVLANDLNLAKKYLRREDNIVDESGCIKPKNYDDAVRILNERAEAFSLQYNIPIDLAWHHEITQPDMRLCARSYLSQTFKAKRT